VDTENHGSLVDCQITDKNNKLYINKLFLYHSASLSYLIYAIVFIWNIVNIQIKIKIKQTTNKKWQNRNRNRNKGKREW